MENSKPAKRVKFDLPLECYDSLMGLLDTLKASYVDVGKSKKMHKSVIMEANERAKAVKGIIWEIKKAKRVVD